MLIFNIYLNLCFVANIICHIFHNKINIGAKSMIVKIIVLLLLACVTLAFLFIFCMPFIFMAGCSINIYKFITGKTVSYQQSKYSTISSRKFFRKSTQVGYDIYHATIKSRQVGTKTFPQPKTREIKDYPAKNNPASGLPMAGSSSIDVGGNAYGTRRF